jgi:tRNA-dihydrouridine synthase B
MQIGKFEIKSKVLLAPMAGISDRPFRTLARKFGVGLTTTEMVVLQQQLLNTSKSKYRLDFRGETSPISVQIAGATPQALSNSAQIAEDLGADIIDINMGCPAKKVNKKMAGSALLADEKLVSDILEKVSKSVSVPITLKTRLGIDNNSQNILNIAKIAQNSGVQILTIHGRTKVDKYSASASYDLIKQVVASVDIPVVANGDITCGIETKKVLEYTGADAVMIGRATCGRPWIIQQINEYLLTGNWQEFTDKKEIILNHIKEIYNFYPEVVANNLVNKHIKWYLFNNNLANFWSEINKINSKNNKIDFLTQLDFNSI